MFSFAEMGVRKPFRGLLLPSMGTCPTLCVSSTKEFISIQPQPPVGLRGGLSPLSPVLPGSLLSLARVLKGERGEHWPGAWSLAAGRAAVLGPASPAPFLAAPCFRWQVAQNLLQGSLDHDSDRSLSKKFDGWKSGLNPILQNQGPFLVPCTSLSCRCAPSTWAVMETASAPLCTVASHR